MRASSVLSLSREKLVKRHVVMRLMARGAGAFWPGENLGAAQSDGGVLMHLMALGIC